MSLDTHKKGQCAGIVRYSDQVNVPFLLINNFKTRLFTRMCRMSKVEESSGLTP